MNTRNGFTVRWKNEEAMICISIDVNWYIYDKQNEDDWYLIGRSENIIVVSFF